MSDRIFMDSAELAAEADCTVERVEELARAGIIPGIKWGRSWRFVRADAPRFCAEVARAEAEERRAQRDKRENDPGPVKPSRRREPPSLAFSRQP